MIMADPNITKLKVNKRSSNSYGVEEWKRHRPLITRLYFEEGRTLKEVREHLEHEYNFAPTERMYKSRLHSWGLDKKKKEHEMLDLVRQGLALKGDDKDKVFVVRGRQVTLADALHYFNRKGIKDPSTLLERDVQFGESSMEASSPEEYDIKTPLSSRAEYLETAHPLDSDYDMSNSPTVPNNQQAPGQTFDPKITTFAENQLNLLRQQLNISQWQPIPKFQRLSISSTVASRAGRPQENSYVDAIYTQSTAFYSRVFSARDMTVGSSSWSSTSDDGLADRFYYCMYHGYGFLWINQRDKAFDEFKTAFGMVPRLLNEHHVGFLVYIFDLIIRHDATGYEEPLDLLLKVVVDAASNMGSNHPIYLIASWLLHPEGEISRPWVAEATMRKLLAYFSDSIGYFHPETIAMLQTFATSLLNGKHYQEAAARFHQLVDAVETTKAAQSYEACYALRSMSEAYFYAGMYREALQTLKMSLDRSANLPREEEREIHVRCFRAMAEIWNKLERRDEALVCMQYVVDCCVNAFGPDHQFVSRARAHQKSIYDGQTAAETAIPPMVYRLGRGGAAAKMIWTTRVSPLRLQS